MTQVIAVEPKKAPGNPAAVVSLIVGLMFCIPGSGLISVATGMWGYRRSRVAGVGQRPAVFGIALGAINLLWSIAFMFFVIAEYRAFKIADPVIKGTRQFIMLVGSGNITSARAMCDESIDESRLTDATEQFQKWGALTEVKDYAGKVHSKSDVEVQDELVFEKFDKIIITHWSVAGNAPQLMNFEFHEAPSTQPATQPG